MKVGYARVSRQDQRLEPQRDVLLADGCERVFEEKISSRESERGALREAFDYWRESDVLVVAKLDRLGRPLRELIDLVGELEAGRGRKLGATTDRYQGAGVSQGRMSRETGLAYNTVKKYLRRLEDG